MIPFKGCIMQIDHIRAFNVALFVALISPEPSFLIVLRSGLHFGKPAGLAVGMGRGLVAAFWTLAALASVDGLFQLFPWAYSALKIAGALYLIVLACGLWKQVANPIVSVHPVSKMPSAVGTWLFPGVLASLLHSNSVIFAAVVLIVIFPQDLRTREKAFIVSNHLVLGWVLYGAPP